MITRKTRNGRLAVLNDWGGLACTLKTQHHYGGNIVCPRQGFREMGVMVIYESEDNRVLHKTNQEETIQGRGI